jgi:hypothetical protein
MTRFFTLRHTQSYYGMYLIAIAWIYVVLMMAVAEAMSPTGGLLGAVVTFVLYGLLPVALLMYILGAPRRGRLRKAAEAEELAALRAAAASAVDPDRGGHAAGDAVAAVRKEP